MTCCEGEGSQDDWHSVRERPALTSTPTPKKGTVSEYHKDSYTKMLMHSLLHAKRGDAVWSGHVINIGALLGKTLI